MDKDQLFDKLVKLSDKIFFYCVKRCNSRMDAENMSQDILLDIIININKEIVIENFDSYIWKICNNHYAKYVGVKVKERGNLLFTDLINEAADNINALEEMIKNKQIQMINNSIKLLSSDYANILYSYYVEDRTLAYIAKDLKLPLGTIKRRLFDIRNKLKEYLNMERLNGKKAYIPKNFSSVMSGGGEINPHTYIDSLIHKNILFHSYNNPCTLEDYSLELGISIPYIEEIVNKLTYATLLKREGKKYITNFPIIEKELDLKLYNIVKEKAKLYAINLSEFARSNFDKFKEIVCNNHFNDNELMWVFMFILNRYIENYPINCKNQDLNYKYTHFDAKGSWNFYMVENHDEFTGYGISENWFGNKNIGIQGISFPGGWGTTEDALFSTLNRNMCVDGSGYNDCLNLEYIEYVIKNPHLKYSEIDFNHKYKIDYLLDQNYIYIEQDMIKFNFVLFSKIQYNQIEAMLKNHIELDEIIDIRDLILEELHECIVEVIPPYLAEDSNAILLGYLVLGLRENCVREFYNCGLIKTNDTGKRFNFNMFVYKLID